MMPAAYKQALGTIMSKMSVQCWQFANESCARPHKHACFYCDSLCFSRRQASQLSAWFACGKRAELCQACSDMSFLCIPQCKSLYQRSRHYRTRIQIHQNVKVSRLLGVLGSAVWLFVQGGGKGTSDSLWPCPAGGCAGSHQSS